MHGREGDLGSIGDVVSFSNELACFVGYYADNSSNRNVNGYCHQ